MADVRDARTHGRIATSCVIKSIFLMFAAQLGSLHALEQGHAPAFWRKWLGDDLPSADTLGRVAAGLALDDLRHLLRIHYRRRKRMKTLLPAWGGNFFLLLDGHESAASYLRCCRQCCTRQIETSNGAQTQYYHRYVAALLVHRDGILPLDIEPQLPGEGEIAAAQRLVERIAKELPRSFDIVVGDALYLNPGLCKRVLALGKDFIAVLKNENRDLIQDARALFDTMTPESFRSGSKDVNAWDLEGFTSWESFQAPVRVVRTIECMRIQRQNAPEGSPPETVESEWMWASSVSKLKLPTRAFVEAGHSRWRIENNLFHALSTQWHGDHIYKHEPNALVAFLLLLLLAFSLTHVFLARNLKPERRNQHNTKFWLECLTAEFHRQFQYTPP